jgi:hypothetical protein
MFPLRIGFYDGLFIEAAADIHEKTLSRTDSRKDTIKTGAVEHFDMRPA